MEGFKGENTNSSRVEMHRFASGPSDVGPTRESDTHRVGLGKPSRATMNVQNGEGVQA